MNKVNNIKFSYVRLANLLP